MNELEFKKHLKDLAHGHHHPEEHDWSQPGPAKKRTPAAAASRSKPRTTRKSSRSK